MQNAFSYGSNRAIFSASSQFLQLGKYVNTQAHTCETFTEWIFGEVETFAKDFEGVMKAVCKYKKLIEEGSELVGLGEAVPIEEIACDETQLGADA